MATAAVAVPRGDVSADLNYYHPPADGSVPYNNIDPAPPLPERNYSDVTLATTIHDIRGREADFTLDRDAFQVIRNVPPSAETAFTSDDSITTRYYPEMEQLLLANVPGATKVYIFDHTIRRSTPGAPRAPVTRVHIDQTAKSVAQRVRRYFSPEESEALLRGRHRLVNVWRPLNRGPVERHPLAFASTRSLEDADVVSVEHRYAGGYTGETAAVRHNPKQEWYYLSGMTGDERLLLECFDSEALREGSGVVGGRAPHSAFADPRTRVEAEDRESIEVRALVFGP
ncbi:methyltransferase [Cordyceps fumosorosea ARSEF 2679]|uniref:Methyltransferase n=1 Tax=Cordyceps fumosorosea (strain ARSEF 2679) TaxID=1081104 RepID=A0A167S5R0_CORFA|nr:methyltransferase [Cordyceps fumosorosea ARSEF 2679]OAA59284.1 methyltransferase [Cordyceps fumosorosea ARSEF 2679]